MEEIIYMEKVARGNQLESLLITFYGNKGWGVDRKTVMSTSSYHPPLPPPPPLIITTR